MSRRRSPTTTRLAGLWLTMMAAAWAWIPPVAAAPLFSPSTKVVLFTPAVPDPLVARIEAELAAVGIAVRRLPLPSASQLDTVVTRELGGGASAAIRIIPRSRGTEVWAGDATARVSSRPSKAGTSDAVLSVIALRTVEFLRATLLDVKRRPATPGALPGATSSPSPVLGNGPNSTVSPGGVTGGVSLIATPGGHGEGSVSTELGAPSRAPTAQVREAVSPRIESEPDSPRVESEPRTEDPPALPAPAPDVSPAPGATGLAKTKTAGAADGQPLQIAAGPAVLASPGGVAPLAALAVIGRAPLVGRLALELMAIFPVTASRSQATDGAAADISVSLFGAAAVLRLTPPHTKWLADVGLGGSATLLRSTGRVSGVAPAVGSAASTETIWRATGHFRVGGGYRFNGWLTGRADALGGVVASRIEVGLFQTNTAGAPDASKFDAFGSWGPAFAAGALSLQANW